MKVHLTLDVSGHERYAIAKYFAVAATTTPDKQRTRATRKQIRRFAAAALRTCVKDLVREMSPRQHQHAVALAEGLPVRDTLPEPREQQRVLQW